MSPSAAAPRRPVIGLCAAVQRGRFGAWEELAVTLPRAYAAATQRAGAMALMLPPDDEVAQRPDEVLDLLDALVLAGGGDLDPASYGARPHPETSGACPERDRFELALTTRALERDLPLLGICRGMELLNVAAGGTLVQHLPDGLGHDRHRHLPAGFADHEVRLEPGSLAARAAGEEIHAVKSHHHQAPDELGDGVVATGWAVEDGLVEAIELPERRFTLGVLWHPEEDERSRVVGALAAQARARLREAARARGEAAGQPSTAG